MLVCKQRTVIVNLVLATDLEATNPSAANAKPAFVAMSFSRGRRSLLLCVLNVYQLILSRRPHCRVIPE